MRPDEQPDPVQSILDAMDEYRDVRRARPDQVPYPLAKWKADMIRALDVDGAPSLDGPNPHLLGLPVVII